MSMPISRKDLFRLAGVGVGALALLFSVCPVPMGAYAQVADQAATSEMATVVNGDSHGATIRFDVDGNAIDAHDGEIQRFGDHYYLYGTGYGCGFAWQTPDAPFCGFRSYESTDLVHWRDDGLLFDAGTVPWQHRCDGATYGCFRPHVLRDSATGRYVLWINTYDVGVGYHVFTSDSPSGPFTEQPTPRLAVNADVPPGVNNGDFDLFRDRDGTAYIAYTDWRQGGDVVVERLRPDYLSGTGDHVRVGLRAVEAPSMFERNGIYYLTVSDPNCGYCATGTSYLTASAPLGPWSGAPATDPYWSVADGQLSVQGGGVGLSRDGASWTDYTLQARVTPLQTGGGGTYAQAGWVFRATDPGDGYAWLLGNYPHQGAEGGNLTKVVFRGGAVASATVVKTPMPIVGGQTYAVRTEVSGTRIRTWVDGVLVDETTDQSYTAGRVGFRESGGTDAETARFDDVRVTAPDGTVLLADDFSGDLSRWDRQAERKGIRISNDSCQGQPADVAELPARGGPVYLYQSDVWNHGAGNEALALHHWEPLRFRADGSIEPLQCGMSYDLPLAGVHDGTPAPDPEQDATAGDLGFHPYCDLNGPYQRAQTFTAGRPGVLDEVRFTAFRAGRPSGPLDLTLTRLAPDGRPGPALVTRELNPDQVGWSPAEVIVHAGVKVNAGDRFALVARSSSATGGCFGIAYSDGDPYDGGGALYSADGGATWRSEQGRDLRVSTYIGAGRT